MNAEKYRNRLEIKTLKKDEVMMNFLIQIFHPGGALCTTVLDDLSNFFFTWRIFWEDSLHL